jgi:alkylation response protein AidB-like acyl-CoA dehydrogenase
MGTELALVQDATRGVLRRFDRAYWLQCARAGRFTRELWSAMAEAGLLGAGAV